MNLSVKADINKLRLYLTHLPATLPCQPSDSEKNFNSFAPDAEWLAEVGLEGAVNRQLEVALGSRANGPIQLKERGPGVVALADVLEQYLEKFPGSAVLEKWLADIIGSAVSAYDSAGLQVRNKKLISKEWLYHNYYTSYQHWHLDPNHPILLLSELTVLKKPDPQRERGRRLIRRSYLTFMTPITRQLQNPKMTERVAAKYIHYFWKFPKYIAVLKKMGRRE